MPDTNVEILNNGMEAASERVFERRRSVRKQSARANGVVLKPFLSCEVVREINTASEDDFHDLVDYQHVLGTANDGYLEDEDKPRYEYDENHTTLVRPEALHITHIYAGHVGKIILQHFADERGNIKKPRDVVGRLSRFSKRYNTEARRFNEQTQDALAYHNGFVPRAPRRTLGEDELEDVNLRMLNGIFSIQKELEPFGNGNDFGLVFDDTSRRFLKAERSRALDILVDTLKIKYLDRELENRILNREHHVTLLRMSPLLRTWDLDVTDVEAKAPMPDIIVTHLDPKARMIKGDDNN